MIARRFTSVIGVAAVGTVVLGCSILSSHVAQERAGLSELDAQIRKTEQSIRTLKTELGTRGRVHQLQHWASVDFGFAAPTAGQFLGGEVTLASLDEPVAVPGSSAPTRMAQVTAPIPGSSEAGMPRAIQASAPRGPIEGAIRRADAERPTASPALRRAVADASAIPAATRAAAPRRERSLLAEGTLRDLDSRARAERGPGRVSARPN